jgi:hypothetical protein
MKATLGTFGLSFYLSYIDFLEWLGYYGRTRSRVERV